MLIFIAILVCLVFLMNPIIGFLVGLMFFTVFCMINCAAEILAKVIMTRHNDDDETKI